MDEALYTNNPAALAIRSHLKGFFVEALYRQPNTLVDWPGAQFVLFGSTLFRQFHFDDGIKFKFGGRKASDIDLGVRTSSLIPQDEFEKKYIQYVAPLIRNVVIELGLWVEDPKDRSKIYPPEEALNLPLEFFAEEFFASRLYDKEHVQKIISKRHPNYDTIMEYCDEIPQVDNKFRIYVDVSSSTLPVPCVMEPLPLSTPRWREGCLQVMRTDREEIVASKLSRATSHPLIGRLKYKPTDLIDLSNLIHAEPKSVLRLDKNDPNNMWEDLRVLYLVYLMIDGLNEKHLLREDLFKPFEFTSENIVAFRKETDPQIVRTKQISNQELRGIYGDCKGMVTEISQLREGQGPLNLTDNDLLFVTSLQGYKRLPSFPGAAPVQMDAFIDVDPLIKEYPQVFARYPNLRKGIQDYHRLNDRVDQHNYRRQNAIGG